MIAYLLTEPEVTLGEIATVLAVTYANTIFADGGVWLRVQAPDGADFDSVRINELPLQIALEEWDADSSLILELFHNAYLQGTSKPFAVTLRNSRPSNQLFPAVVRCLADAGMGAVVVGQFGLHLPADDFLRRFDANPAWQWDHETVPRAGVVGEPGTVGGDRAPVVMRGQGEENQGNADREEGPPGPMRVDRTIVAGPTRSVQAGEPT